MYTPNRMSQSTGLPMDRAVATREAYSSAVKPVVIDTGSE